MICNESDEIILHFESWPVLDVSFATNNKKQSYSISRTRVTRAFKTDVCVLKTKKKIPFPPLFKEQRGRNIAQERGIENQAIGRINLVEFWIMSRTDDGSGQVPRFPVMKCIIKIYVTMGAKRRALLLPTRLAS